MELKKHFRPSLEELEAFIDRHSELLLAERSAEEEQTHLLNSKCSPRLLEQRGLAIGSLGVSSISVGLGGKTLVELHRPPAFHTSSNFPSHTFRSGDPCRIEAHVAGNEAGQKGKGKAKKAEDDTAGVEGVVSRVFQDKIVVAVDEGKDVNLPERLRILKLANSITFDRLERTLAHLKRIVTRTPTVNADGSTVAPNPPDDLTQALLGLSTPSWQDTIPPARDSDSTDIKWFDPTLNDSQREAVRFCLSSGQVACIHGPPGTGKTHTLVELILQLLARPANPSTSLPPRLLIATPSNLALDNILLRLQQISTLPEIAPLLPPGSILRLGHPTRVHRELLTQTLDWRAANGNDGEVVKGVKEELEGHMSDLNKKRGEKGAVKGKDRGVKWQEIRELRKEYRQREAKVVKNVVGAAQVVLATCHGAGSKQINNVAFDICIIDEVGLHFRIAPLLTSVWATQAIEAACWIPVLRSRRLILAGDPQQLPPTIMGKPGPIKNLQQISKKDKDANADSADQTLGTRSSEHDPVSDVASSINLSLTKPLGVDVQVATSASGISDLAIAAEDMSRLRPPRTLERTLFERLERLYGPGIKRVLTTQYRMNAQIAAFPSEELYENALISAASVRERTLLSLPSIEDPSSEDAQDALSHPVIFFDTAGCEFSERSDADGDIGRSTALGDGSRSNANEAEVVTRWARELIRLGVPPQDIAIVTPYQAQVALLSASLHEEFPEMTIGSVDGLQGQEREAIIVSLVRSNPKGEVGFLSEHRRMNVAMTRAKRQLCVVGDSATVSKGSDYLRKWLAWLESEADVRWAGEGA